MITKIYTDEEIQGFNALEIHELGSSIREVSDRNHLTNTTDKERSMEGEVVKDAIFNTSILLQKIANAVYAIQNLDSK